MNLRLINMKQLCREIKKTEKGKSSARNQKYCETRYGLPPAPTPRLCFVSAVS